MIPTTADQLPKGFRVGAAGLILPESQSRKRRALTWQEWRAIEAAAKVMNDERFNAEFVARCKNEDCPSRKIERVRDVHGMILRCGCCDRVFNRR